MRLLRLIMGDIRFQIKYGFYFVYGVFSVVYISLLYALPEQARETARTLLIFSDPAAMGLFFMGAIILFEKSQRVINSIAVSPVKVSEYIIAKVTALGITGTAVAVIIALGTGERDITGVIAGTFLGSFLFSLCGLISAAFVNSLNRFMIVTIPFELLCMLPLLSLFGVMKGMMKLHPGSIVIELICGDYGVGSIVRILYLCIFIFFLYLTAKKVVTKMFRSMGGVKL